MMSSLFPSILMNFLLEIENEGFSLCLVGGAVRDYIKTGKFDVDLDFEIRSKSNNENIDWEKKYQKLIVFLDKKSIKYITLPYLITRVYFDKWSLEFSSPRTEEFEFDDKFSHHNFKANLSDQLSYLESFERRDFTLNAIGLELEVANNKMNLIDPFKGMEDLKNNTLKNIDLNFFRDPVRFLRLIRFHSKYNLMISSEIINNISMFNLTELTEFHFSAELFKGEPGTFLNNWKAFIQKYKLQTSSKFSVWHQLNFEFPNGLNTKEDIFIYVFFKQHESAQKVSDFFSMPKSIYFELKKYYEAVTMLKSLNKEIAREVINLGLSQFKNHVVGERLKVLNEKIVWKSKIENLIPDFHRDLKFDWSIFDKVQITEADYAKIPNLDRGYYKLFLGLKDWSDSNE